MEIVLKDGWWDYFFSGLATGLLVMLLVLFSVFPENIPLVMFVVGLSLVLCSVVAFIRGCRVRRKQKPEESQSRHQGLEY